MSKHHHLSARQVALLRYLAEAGPSGADVRAHKATTVKTCDTLGLITFGDLSPAGFHRFITQLGIDELAYHDAIGTHPRGFQGMSPEKIREISSKGGVAAHEKGVAHEFRKGDPLAISAGKKGAAASLASRARSETNR